MDFTADVLPCTVSNRFMVRKVPICAMVVRVDHRLGSDPVLYEFGQGLFPGIRDRRRGYL